jgi:hypothetical protein
VDAVGQFVALRSLHAGAAHDHRSHVGTTARRMTECGRGREKMRSHEGVVVGVLVEAHLKRKDLAGIHVDEQHAVLGNAGGLAVEGHAVGEAKVEGAVVRKAKRGHLVANLPAAHDLGQQAVARGLWKAGEIGRAVRRDQIVGWKRHVEVVLGAIGIDNRLHTGRTGGE